MPQRRRRITRRAPRGIVFKPRIRRLLYKALEAGLPQNRACDLVGLSWNTFNRWCDIGRVSSGANAYKAFYERIKRIEARREARLLGIIEKVAQGEYKIHDVEITLDKNGRSFKRRTRTARPEWKAAAWRLERLYPEDYGQRIEDLSALTAEEIAHDIKQASDVLFGSVPVSDENESD